MTTSDDAPPPAGPVPGSGPDLRLVERVGAPDWEAIYRDNVVLVYRFAHARTGNRPDAEDVTAQVFVRALPRLRAGAHPGEVRAYLFATARTVLADHWASQYGVELAEMDDLDLPAAPDTPGDGGAARATAILERLPDNYRQVLELRFLRGYSIRDTAREMAVTVTNAKVLQWRALRRAARIDETGAETARALPGGRRGQPRRSREEAG